MVALRAADLFCGAGGTTTGAELSGCVRVALAVNHWRTAVQTHSANHPDVRHICAEIDMVDPRDFVGMGIDVLLASPECVFHSNARGGLPVDDQRRATAWCVPRWAEVLRPKWIVVENVREFENWAPLGSDNRPLKSKKGHIFNAWIATLRAINYHVEWKLLNAADFGGATKRVRLFVVARRGQSTKPIPWPAITHTKEKWATAASIIDWSLPCPSIFNRKRPLADKTLRRIEAGIRKFVHSPFQFKAIGRNPGQTKSILDPLPTIVATRENHAIVCPFVSTFHNGVDGHNRNYGIDEPLPVQDTQNRHGLVSPFLMDVNHGGDADRSSTVNQPLGTLTVKNGKSLVLPFLTEYFGNGGARSIESPVSTITTKHRHGLAIVQLVETMKELGMHDIGFRMLEPHELAAAQGFPRGYEIYGSKADQVKQIGNSVHTFVAKAICEAIGGVA